MPLNGPTFDEVLRKTEGLLRKTYFFMSSNDFLKMDYAEVFPFASVDDPALPALDAKFELAFELGQHSCLSHFFSGIQTCFLEGSFNKPIEIGYQEPKDNFSFCFNFEGSVASRHCGKVNHLEKGFYNFFYDPDPEKAHFFNRGSAYDIFHITVEADTMLSLIGTNDPLHEKLTKSMSEEAGIAGFRQNMPLSPHITSIIQSIRYCALKGAARRLFIESKVYELLALQIDAWQKEFGTRPLELPHRKDTETMYAVRDYLQIHFQDDLSLRAICKEFGVNECKLKSGFKKQFGNTVFGYIQELRMEFARQLLLQQQTTVGMVADKLGYRNANHFSTAFRKFFGESPSSVRA